MGDLKIEAGRVYQEEADHLEQVEPGDVHFGHLENGLNVVPDGQVAPKVLQR